MPARYKEALVRSLGKTCVCCHGGLVWRGVGGVAQISKRGRRIDFGRGRQAQKNSPAFAVLGPLKMGWPSYFAEGGQETKASAPECENL